MASLVWMDLAEIFATGSPSYSLTVAQAAHSIWISVELVTWRHLWSTLMSQSNVLVGSSWEQRCSTLARTLWTAHAWLWTKNTL